MKGYLFTLEGLLAIALLGVSSGVQATIVDPATVAGMRWRLDADAITGLVDGQSVSTWLDTSGNSFNATQTTSATQPSYQTGEMPSGKPVVRFDGLDDFMDVPSSLALSGPMTWFLVYRQNNTTGNQTLVGVDGGGLAQNDVVLIPSSGGYQTVTFWMNGTIGVAPRVGFSPTLDTTGHILAIAYNGGGENSPASYQASYDQASQTIVASGVAGVTGDAIGAQNGGSVNFLNGDLAEIIVFTNTLVAADFTGIQEYLYDKWFLAEAVVPEPSTLMLIGLGGLLLWRRQRRK